MRRAALVIGLSCLAVGCSGAAQEETAAESVAAATADPRAEALARGKRLYEANCATCHGAGALGDGPAASGLPVQPANILEHLGDHGYEDMVRMVGEGIPPAMPPAPIDAGDVRLVLNYVWTLVPEADRPRLRALQEMAAEEH